MDTDADLKLHTAWRSDRLDLLKHFQSKFHDAEGSIGRASLALVAGSNNVGIPVDGDR